MVVFFLSQSSKDLRVLKLDFLISGLNPGAMRPGLDHKMSTGQEVVGLEGQGEWRNE